MTTKGKPHNWVGELDKDGCLAEKIEIFSEPTELNIVVIFFCEMEKCNGHYL